MRTIWIILLVAITMTAFVACNKQQELASGFLTADSTNSLFRVSFDMLFASPWLGYNPDEAIMIEGPDAQTVEMLIVPLPNGCLDDHNSNIRQMKVGHHYRVSYGDPRFIEGRVVNIYSTTISGVDVEVVKMYLGHKSFAHIIFQDGFCQHTLIERVDGKKHATIQLPCIDGNDLWVNIDDKSLAKYGLARWDIIDGPWGLAVVIGVTRDEKLAYRYLKFNTITVCNGDPKFVADHFTKVK